MWLEAAFISVLGVLSQASLFGTVRSSGDGAALPGAVVELPLLHRKALTGTNGAYSFGQLEPGRYDLVVKRSGYRPRELVVVLAPGDSLRLDVALEAVPRPLTPLVVVGRPDPRDATSDSADRAFPELGTRSLGAHRVRTEGSWLAQPDALAAFAGAPGVAFDTERSASLHVHGGESDQNLLLIDDAPVYAPYHFGTTVGVLNPDALAGIDLHAGVPSATWGNALSSVVTARSLSPGRSRVGARGALGPMHADLTIDGPLTSDVGFLVSARGDYPSLFSRYETDSHLAGATGDVLGKLSADVKRGTVELLFLRSDNVLRFPMVAESSTAASDSTALGSPVSGDLRATHRFAWSGTTSSARWDSPAGPTRASAQLWRADLSTSVDWQSLPRVTEVASARSGTGLKTRMTRTLSRGSLVAGFDLERDRVMYAVREVGDTGRPPLAVDSTMSRAAAFLEHRYVIGRFETSAGVRATLGTEIAPHLEPRVGIRYRLSSAVGVGAGFARMYQPVQSLRNPASLPSALFSADLPVMSVAPGRPAARADQVVVEINAQPDRQSLLTVEGYWRWLQRLVLVEPTTALPFAPERYDVGSGEASGLSFAYERHTGRAALAATYSLALSSRGAGEYEYHVGFLSRHALVSSVAFNATPRTLLRLAAVAHSSTPTSVVRGPFDFEACDPLGMGCEAAGTPQGTVGPLNGERVPGYLRVDAGIRHAWTLHLGARTQEVAAYASYGNVLGRRNLWAYTSTSGELDRRVGVAARPPSLLAAGLDWRW